MKIEGYAQAHNDYNENQKLIIKLFEEFFLKAMEKCSILCKENGITHENLILFGNEYRNITTFELANGWQLDYMTEYYFYEHYIKYDVDPKEAITIPMTNFHQVFTIYPDSRRYQNPCTDYNAIFRVGTENEIYVDKSQWQFDEFLSFMNLRLSLISKMNKNHLDALNHDNIFFNTWAKDTYALTNLLLFEKRIIKGTIEEINFMKELIDLLDDLKIIKSVFYKANEFGFSLEKKELKLPLTPNSLQLLKKVKLKKSILKP